MQDTNQAQRAPKAPHGGEWVTTGCNKLSCLAILSSLLAHLLASSPVTFFWSALLAPAVVLAIIRMAQSTEKRRNLPSLSVFRSSLEPLHPQLLPRDARGLAMTRPPLLFTNRPFPHRQTAALWCRALLPPPPISLFHTHTRTHHLRISRSPSSSSSLSLPVLPVAPPCPPPVPAPSHTPA